MGVMKVPEKEDVGCKVDGSPPPESVRALAPVDPNDHNREDDTLKRHR